MQVVAERAGGTKMVEGELPPPPGKKRSYKRNLKKQTESTTPQSQTVFRGQQVVQNLQPKEKTIWDLKTQIMKENQQSARKRRLQKQEKSEERKSLSFDKGDENDVSALGMPPVKEKTPEVKEGKVGKGRRSQERKSANFDKDDENNVSALGMPKVPMKTPEVSRPRGATKSAKKVKNVVSKAKNDPAPDVSASEAPEARSAPEAQSAPKVPKTPSKIVSSSTLAAKLEKKVKSAKKPAPAPVVANPKAPEARSAPEAPNPRSAPKAPKSRSAPEAQSAPKASETPQKTISPPPLAAKKAKEIVSATEDVAAPNVPETPPPLAAELAKEIQKNVLPQTPVSAPPTPPDSISPIPTHEKKNIPARPNSSNSTLEDALPRFSPTLSSTPKISRLAHYSPPPTARNAHVSSEEQEETEEKSSPEEFEKKISPIKRKADAEIEEENVQEKKLKISIETDAEQSESTPETENALSPTPSLKNFINGVVNNMSSITTSPPHLFPFSYKDEVEKMANDMMDSSDGSVDGDDDDLVVIFEKTITPKSLGEQVEQDDVEMEVDVESMSSSNSSIRTNGEDDDDVVLLFEKSKPIEMGERLEQEAVQFEDLSDSEESIDSNANVTSPSSTSKEFTSSYRKEDYYYKTNATNIGFDAQNGFDVKKLEGIPRDLGQSTLVLLPTPYKQEKPGFCKIIVENDTRNPLPSDLRDNSLDIIRLMLIKNAANASSSNL